MRRLRVDRSEAGRQAVEKKLPGHSEPGRFRASSARRPRSWASRWTMRGTTPKQFGTGPSPVFPCAIPSRSPGSSRGTANPATSISPAGARDAAAVSHRADWRSRTRSRWPPNTARNRRGDRVRFLPSHPSYPSHPLFPRAPHDARNHHVRRRAGPQRRVSRTDRLVGRDRPGRDGPRRLRPGDRHDGDRAGLRRRGGIGHLRVGEPRRGNTTSSTVPRRRARWRFLGA